MKQFTNILFVFIVLFIAFLISCQNELDGYKKFQTFNEYTLKGEGEPTDTPFVFVKNLGSKIFVIKSNKLDDIIEYQKIDTNLWFSMKSFDMHKMKPKYKFNQTEFGYPRTYYRLFLGDTIIEYLKQMWGADIPTTTNLLFIKTPHTCTEIGIDSICYQNIKELACKMLSLSHNYTHLNNLQLVDNKIWYYKMKGWYISFDCIKNDSIVKYIAKRKNDNVCYNYHINSLHEYALPYGLEIQLDQEIFFK